MNLYAEVRGWVLAALEDLALPAELLAKVEVTPARDVAHGDMASNAAMVCAKPAGVNPRELAAKIAARLGGQAGIAKAEPAGPGFVNLFLQPELLLAQVPVILAAGEAYGQGAKRGKINVEYVSANPTGPLHVGHCRGAVVGDALANLLAKAGYEVTKEFYVNDAGAQVAALARSVYARYLEALDLAAHAKAYAESVAGGLQYGGDYLVPAGFMLAEKYQDKFVDVPEAEWIDVIRDEAVAAMLALIKEDLAALRVRHDVFTSERALVEAGAVTRALAALQARGLLYRGVLEPPKGKTPEDWEPREQALFRSTGFGDDIDRPVQKSDGSNTYFANDIAYHADKMARGFEAMIDVWGADHGGYVKRMQAAVRALGDENARLDVTLCQIVRVMKDGQPVKMSKRAGTFVELRDLIDEVGPDAVRFLMLMRKADAQMEFDLNAAVAQTRDNPIFYVQYAHARCRSVLRAAEHDQIYANFIAGFRFIQHFVPDVFAADGAHELLNDSFLKDSFGLDLLLLNAPEELAVIRMLIGWPRLVEQAAEAREPHRIAFYLYDLAAAFHALWNAGRDDAALRFLQADKPAETAARVALVAAVAIVIRAGLAVAGVQPVEEMR